MAVRIAVASGNWSDPATWDGGTTPGNGDTVYSNGYTVTIDQAVTIGGSNNPTVSAGSFVVGQYYQIAFSGNTPFASIGASNNNVGTVFLATGVGSGNGTAVALATVTNLANATVSAVAGGTFTFGGNHNISAYIRCGSVVCVSGSLSGDITIEGDIIGSRSGAAATGCSLTGSGTVTLIGSVFGGSQGLGSNGLTMSGSLSLVMAGNITAGSSTSSIGVVYSASGTAMITGNIFGRSPTNCWGFQNGSSSLVTINGNVYGGSGLNAYGVNNTGSGTVVINGNVYGGDSSPGTAMAAGACNGSGTMQINGTVNATSTSAGFFSTSTTGINVINASLFDPSNGMHAVYAYKTITSVAPSNQTIRKARDGSSEFSYFYSSDYSGFDLPATSNVRNGIVYASGSQTGTCYVPSASSVAYGVPVDNTTGTAVLTPENIKAAIWDQDITQLTTPNSIGARLKNASTVETTGSQIATAISA